MKRNKPLSNSPGRRVSSPQIFPRQVAARFRFYSSLTVALAALVLIGSSQFPKAGAQKTRARVQQDLAQVFMNHEEISLDPRVVADQVMDTGRVSLVTSSHDFELQLQPNDLRAPNYRAEQTDPDGVVRTTAMPGVTTYKGNVADVWASDARFTIDGQKIEGMIITPTQSYFIEPAQKYSSSAASTDYLLYTADDVRPDITRICGDTLEQQVSAGAKEMTARTSATDGVSPAVFSPFKQVEVATESDLEYTNALGGASQANSDILSIMNSISAIYERDIGMTFKVTYQHAWTTADPYGAGGLGAAAVLNAFTNDWNRNPITAPHDVSHLWTGKQLTDANGVAWQGVVCANPTHAYGISDRETIAPFRVTIPAHEFGHNFNASHADSGTGHPECDNTIMVTIQNQNNTSFFCPFSIGEITGYVQNNSSCLTDVPASNPIDQSDFFVRQHYADFLNRNPDASGLAFWTNEIESCGADANCRAQKRINVSGAFFLSIEFQETGYLVERTYKTAYGDATGTSTLNGTHTLPVPVVRFNEFLTDQRAIANGIIVNQGDWQAALERNKVAYFDSFVKTTRFTNSYPSNMLPTNYVHTLNVNAGSPMSAAEESQEVAKMVAGRTRAQVLRDIAEHPALAKSELNRAFVLMQFYGYLRRNPNDAPDRDYTGYDFWLSKLNQFNGDYVAAEMVKAFITSAEYRQRFGPP
jgi:Metallo-peptidase family M12